MGITLDSDVCQSNAAFAFSVWKTVGGSQVHNICTNVRLWKRMVSIHYEMTPPKYRYNLLFSLLCLSLSDSERYGIHQNAFPAILHQENSYDILRICIDATYHSVLHRQSGLETALSHSPCITLDRKLWDELYTFR
jgi:hypothetical protein